MNSDIILWIALLYLLKCSCNISNTELACFAALIEMQYLGCGCGNNRIGGGNSCGNSCGCGN